MVSHSSNISFNYAAEELVRACVDGSVGENDKLTEAEDAWLGGHHEFGRLAPAEFDRLEENARQSHFSALIAAADGSFSQSIATRANAFSFFPRRVSSFLPPRIYFPPRRGLEGSRVRPSRGRVVHKHAANVRDDGRASKTRGRSGGYCAHCFPPRRDTDSGREHKEAFSGGMSHRTGSN